MKKLKLLLKSAIFVLVLIKKLFSLFQNSRNERELIGYIAVDITYLFFVADVFCCIYQTETGQQNNCYVGKLNGQHHPLSDLKSAGTEVYKKGKV